MKYIHIVLSGAAVKILKSKRLTSPARALLHWDCDNVGAQWLDVSPKAHM